MNKKLFNVLLVAGGAAAGSLATWYIVKTRYERILQEEIESVKETWSYMSQRDSEAAHCSEEEDFDYTEDDADDETMDFDETDVINYYQIASGYKSSGDTTENDREGEQGDDEVPYINGPVVILPEDFGNGDYNHDLYCITYYSDGVLADDWGKKLDIEETIGRESLDHFGDYAKDMLYVRNERTQTDYEVTREDRTYSDMAQNDPLMSVHED